MSATIKKILSILILTIAATYLYLHSQDFAILLSIQPAQLLTVLLLIFAFFISTGFTFFLLVKMVNIQISILEILSLTFLTNFFNYLGPLRPGAAIKAIYLKSQKGLSFSTFSAVLAANAFLMLFFTGFIGLILLVFLWFNMGILPIELLIISSAVCFFSAIPFVIPIPQIKRNSRFWKNVQLALDGFAVIKKQKLMIVFVLTSILFQFVVAAWLNVIVFTILGEDVSFLMGMVIGVFNSLSNLFTITPNNLGLQEFVIAYLYSLMGVDFRVGVTGAAFIRGGHMLLTFTLSPVLGYFMLKKSSVSWSHLYNKTN